MNKHLPKLPQYVLGLIYFVFGAAGLFNLLPQPTDIPPPLQIFMNGLMVTKYFFPLLKATEMICGLLLLIGIAPALMLVILAPITLNILLLHGFVTPGLKELVLPVIMVGLHIFTARRFWSTYKPLFSKQA
jgi:putative oxidoreductase